MKPIENLLRREIGLDAASVGSSLIERAVRLRMKALGLAKPADYHHLLTEHAGEEWEELVEALVVTETWFFRDQEPFSVFVQLFKQALSPASKVQSPESGISDAGLGTRDFSEPVRILSLPCSTGEEPYSLAMALLDARVAHPRFVIDAVDISARALERAQQAVFGKNSFRGQSLKFRDRHFAPTEDGWKLNGDVRQAVHFLRGNLLAESFSAGRAPYDFIFCRNLLIYFDRATQARALQKLDGLLAPHGVLFVGPAEVPLVSDRGFVSAGLPMAFACRRAGDLPLELPHPVAQNQVGLMLSRDGNGSGQTRRDTRVSPRRRRVTDATPDLNVARTLADAGKLAAASAICEAHVQAQGPSAQAYYLIGLVRDADGDPAALDYYRKALYLEPKHYETLLQLAFLLEKNGDAGGAQSLRRRAARSQPISAQ